MVLTEGEILRIRNMLTLRYHPYGNTLLPKLGWKDFVPYDGIDHRVISSLVSGSIRNSLHSDIGKIAVAISGGIDSSTILSLLRHSTTRDIHTYCVTFGNHSSEVEGAKAISEIYGTKHRHISIDNPLQYFYEQIKIVGEPRWNIYPYFLFDALKRDGCDTLFTGDGGDELFGGYVFRYRMRPLSARTYLDCHNRDWVPDQDKMFRIPFMWENIYALIEPYFANPLSALGKVFLADYNGKLLYDFMPVTKALSGYFNIRVISPFLSPDVLGVATHVPYSLKYDYMSNIGKIILRQILVENHGHQATIKNKIGWGMDLVEIWDKYLSKICITGSSLCVELGIINKDWLYHAIKKADDHDLRYISKMYGLYALETWFIISTVDAEKM